MLAMTWPGAGLVVPGVLGPPHLEIQPPQLVRHDVDEMRAKTVFHEKLDPKQSRVLGMAADMLVPI